MKKVFISEKANGILREYLRSLGYSPVNISTNGIVDEPISCHPDVFMCKLGVDDDSPVIFASGSDVGFGYPSDSVFNAACTGEFFFHKLAVTNPRLLSAAGSFSKSAPTGMKFVDVRQGYTKCSMVVVDRNSIITYDKGIIKACSMYPEINVLEVEPGHCFLEGYDTGFIGGCSGRVGNKVIFNGNLKAHPDFQRILSFIKSRGLDCVWFPEYELTDIGSIITCEE